MPACRRHEESYIRDVMTSARRHKAFGAVTGWWATAARALALLLALAVSAPAAGIADDVAYHRSDRSTVGIGFVSAPYTTAWGGQISDPGLTCHNHCGCHIVANLDVAELSSLPEVSRPSYERMSETATSIFPNRLPRPPRA